MVDVFREVRRVLADDGTLWLNLGSSYATNPSNGRGGEGSGLTKGGKAPHRSVSDRSALGNKQLLGIPWRVAFALQADGWYLRCDCIWHKPNPMPESVRDRPTKSHEYLFLMSKRKRYYYDADAIREPESRSWSGRNNGRRWTSGDAEGVVLGRKTMPNSGLVNSGSKDGSRNRRSVWTIAPRPYKGAAGHFAVMPPALVEPCIRAGSAPGDVVLDPFVGSGTVPAVAVSLSRNAIGIDLNESYLELARRRIDAALAEAAAGGLTASPPA